MLGDQLAFVVNHEAQHQPQLAKAAIEHIAAAQLIGFDRIVEMLSHQKELPDQQFSERAVFARDRLRKRVEVVNHPLVLLDHVEAVSLLRGVFRGSLDCHDVGAAAPPNQEPGARPQNERQRRRYR